MQILWEEKSWRKNYEKFYINISFSNFTNPEFQFPQFKVLQSVFNTMSYIGIFERYLDINLKLLSGKNTQKVYKQNIRDS
jgi:hypothetical protein